MHTTQLPLFSPARVAHRPYCTNDPSSGVRIRSQAQAFGCSHIQANTPSLRFRMVFDIDRPGAVFAAEDGGVAAPNWIAENPRNGHAHLSYEIAVPIVTSDAGRLEPVRFAAAVEQAYCRALDADKGYVGLICKNPLHPDWRIQTPRVEAYDLQEMSEWVTLKKLTKAEEVETPLGRNVELFHRLRQWAYRNIKKHSNYEQWLFFCQAQATAFNNFTTPLPLNEVSHTAKSVAKWVWRHFDTAASDKRFSELQAFRGRAGGVKSGETRALQSDAHAIKAKELYAQGMTQRAIAATIGVSQKTVSNLLRRFE